MPRKTRKPIGKKTAGTLDIPNTSSLLPLYPTRAKFVGPGGENPRAKAAPKKTAPLGRGKKR